GHTSEARVPVKVGVNQTSQVVEPVRDLAPLPRAEVTARLREIIAEVRERLERAPTVLDWQGGAPPGPAFAGAGRFFAAHWHRGNTALSGSHRRPGCRGCG